MKKSFSSQQLVSSQNLHVAKRQPEHKKILRIDTWTSESCVKPTELTKNSSRSKLISSNALKTKGPMLNTPLSALKSTTSQEAFSSKLAPKTRKNQEIPRIQNFNVTLNDKTNASRLQDSIETNNDYSKQFPENNSSWFSEKKFLPQSSLTKSSSSKKLYTPSHIQSIKPKEKEAKNSNSEFRDLQIKISKLLDKTQEKLKLEEIRNLSPQRKEMQHVFDEIEDLRKITHSQNMFKKHTSFEKIARQSTHQENNNKGNLTLYEMDRGEQLNRINYNSTSTPQLHSKPLTLDVSPKKKLVLTEEPVLTEANVTFSRLKTQDPFDKMILYQDNKMPFSLALMAKMRHKMFKEVKQQTHEDVPEVDKTSVITILRERLVPEEKARFLEKLDEVEKLKKYDEMKSKKANTSAIYQLIAMNKTSQQRLKSKMKEQFPVNSRFLKL